jgi:hypothetical protein
VHGVTNSSNVAGDSMLRVGNGMEVGALFLCIPFIERPSVPEVRRKISSLLISSSDIVVNKFHFPRLTNTLADFIPHDPQTLMVTSAPLAVAFVSSAYSAAIPQAITEFHCNAEVTTLSTSLFVL